MLGAGRNARGRRGRRSPIALAWLLALAWSAALAGCGNEIARPPDTRVPDAPAGTRELEIEGAGLTLTVPANWTDLAPQGQRLGGVQSKRATVAVWRYPRTETLPADAAALEQAKKRLIERVTARDPSFSVREIDTPRRDGARTIEILGRQTAAGRPLGVRSAHLFHAGAEIVIDAYAPPEYFERVDETVFVPLLESIELEKAAP